MFLCGCDDNNRPTAKYEKTGTGYDTYDIIVIDGCQYVMMWRRMAHKGNCTNLIHKYNKIEKN